MLVHDGVHRYHLADVIPLSRGRRRGRAHGDARPPVSPGNPPAPASSALALAVAAMDARDIPTLMQLLPRVAEAEGLADSPSASATGPVGGLSPCPSAVPVAPLGFCIDCGTELEPPEDLICVTCGWDRFVAERPWVRG